MKKFKKLGYLIIIIVLVVLGLTIYVNATNKESSEEDKILAEIKYIENTISDLMNSLNNIETRNYNISIEKPSKETENKISGGSSSDSKSQNSGSSSSGGDASQSADSTDSSNNQDNKQYELNLEGILTNSDEIDWKEIKLEVENLYLTIPTFTMDLYQYDINNEDILNFNKELDTLTTIVASENKKETMKQLSNMYNKLSDFLQVISIDNLYKTKIKAKANILSAYSKLEDDDWEGMQKDIKNAIDIYSNLLADTSISANKQNNINKIYIMLNELQNAISIKDKSVFLIKYRNIIEEMEE